MAEFDISAQVSDMVADGRITDTDAYHVLKFAEFLRLAGPMKPPFTADQQARRDQWLSDPEWREWLGLNHG